MLENEWDDIYDLFYSFIHPNSQKITHTSNIRMPTSRGERARYLMEKTERQTRIDELKYLAQMGLPLFREE